MTNKTNRIQAEKAPFEAFGILYYPVYESRADFDHVTLDDEDIAWATTAMANLDDTAYALSAGSINVLAAYHHQVAEAMASPNPVIRNAVTDAVPDPLADILRLVPDVTATPMYPDFPTQVMSMDEVTFRYHQCMHYASTYGVEFVAGLLGLDVTVGEGWLPDVTSTEKTRRDEPLVDKTVLHVVMDKETMLSVVNARFAKATRMHPAEIQTAMLLVESVDDLRFGKIAFHENMLELILAASDEPSGVFANAIGAVAQHPGDILKAIPVVVEYNVASSGKRHLSTRQKKGFCIALERFEPNAIAQNIVDGNKQVRTAPNYLSISRFAGENLRSGVRLVEEGRVRSWNSRLEDAWQNVKRDGFGKLVGIYGSRPGMLLRSMTRLVKEGCDVNLLSNEVLAHTDDYSLPTIVRNLAIMTAMDDGIAIRHVGVSSWKDKDDHKVADDEQKQAYQTIAPILLQVLKQKLERLDTPLKGKRVFLDRGGVSLTGSVIMPNDTGDTGTAWPPVGIAYEVPKDKVVRFFTFWDDREHRVDVDLHFYGNLMNGSSVHIGWNSRYNTHGMTTSGDITTSHDSVEYLDIDMAAASAEGVSYVVQHDDIFSGRSSWEDIQTCYSGATLVGNTDADVVLYDRKNVLFRDDMTGEGRSMDYALIDVQGGYVRILRGTSLPFIRTRFTLEAYLRALFDAQAVTLVDDPSEADVTVNVGRSVNEGDISLFDEGFYIG